MKAGWHGFRRNTRRASSLRLRNYWKDNDEMLALMHFASVKQIANTYELVHFNVFICCLSLDFKNGLLSGSTAVHPPGSLAFALSPTASSQYTFCLHIASSFDLREIWRMYFDFVNQFRFVTHVYLDVHFSWEAVKKCKPRVESYKGLRWVTYRILDNCSGYYQFRYGCSARKSPLRCVLDNSKEFGCLTLGIRQSQRKL